MPDISFYNISPFDKNFHYSELPIYVHVPFCRNKCGYCDFFSQSSEDRQLQEKVVSGILIQMETLLLTLGPENIPSIYIGGGTPNSLPLKLFQKLITGIAGLASPYMKNNSMEWTVELNPELITDEQLFFLKDTAVNRLSIGVQSFSQYSLDLIERNAGLDETLKGLSIVVAHWNRRWNLDIITGMPEQSIQDAVFDIKSALSYGPSHISLYTLGIEAHTPLHEKVQSGKILPKSGDETAEFLLRLWEILSEKGFQHYEISNFALPQEESRHNLYYWHLQPYAGLGPGSVSTLRAPQGSPARVITPPSVHEFASIDNPISLLEGESVSPHQFLLEYLMMGLRTIPGIDIEAFKSIFDIELQHLLAGTLQEHFRRKNMRLHNRDAKTYLSLTESGMMILDHILVQAVREIEDFKGLRLALHWPL